jgi:rod shape determining protein RodA
MPWHIALLALVLTGIGAAFILSARATAEVPEQLAIKHLEFAAIGCVAFAALALLDYRHLGTAAVLLYAAGLLALAGLAFSALTGKPWFGVERNFARRWYDLKFFLLQPSEPMKLVLVVALASYFQLRKGLDRIRDLAVPLALTALPMVLIAAQPDFGTALMLLPTFFVIAFLAGVRLRILALLAVLGCTLAGAAWLSPWPLKDYQRNRVIAFVQPDRVAGTNAAEHTEQVLRAIRAGGLHGEGWGQGVLNQRGMLSERHTDFIFAVIAEEWGFYRTAVVAALYLVLIGALGHATLRTRDPFGRLLAGGVMSVFAVQSLLNMAIAVRLAPITGLTLPLVSYGGSSLVTTFAGLGLVASVRMRRSILWTDEQPGG